MPRAIVLTTLVLLPVLTFGCAEGGGPMVTGFELPTSDGDDGGADTSITTVAPTGGDDTGADTMGVDDDQGVTDDDAGSTDASATDGGSSGAVTNGSTDDGSTDGGESSSEAGGESSSESGRVQEPVTVCSSPGTAIGPDAGAVTLDSVDLAAWVGGLGDVNVEIQATHTFVGDLTITIEHVSSGTSVTLIQADCSLEDDIDGTFDDAAAAPPACGVPAVSGAVQPTGLLSSFNGLMDPTGSWQLSITDGANADGGSLAMWCVEFSPV